MTETIPAPRSTDLAAAMHQALLDLGVPFDNNDGFFMGVVRVRRVARNGNTMNVLLEDGTTFRVEITPL